MKVLEPISPESVPKLGSRGPVSPFEELFQQARSLDGLALPVECDNIKQAQRLAYSCHVRRGRGQVLGLRAAQRGKTVFLYKRDRA